MIERTLVIGATGYIGRAVTRLLGAEGWNVTAMRRWDSSAAEAELDVPDLVADVHDRRELLHAMSGMNYVVYAAAPDPDLDGDVYRRRATEAIRNVLDVAREADVDRVVVTSSAATIGDGGDGRDELADESSYYLPGSAADHFVEAAYEVEQECFREAADGRYVVLINPSVVLGPGARLPSMRRLRGATDDEPVNWVDLGRVARAHVRALEWGRRGERYIVGGRNTTLEDLYATARSRDEMRVGGDGWFSLGRTSYRNRYLLTDGQWLDTGKGERDLGL